MSIRNCYRDLIEKYWSIFSPFSTIFGKNQEKLYPAEQYNKLNENCKKLIVEAENDSKKQYYIGNNLL